MVYLSDSLWIQVIQGMKPLKTDLQVTGLGKCPGVSHHPTNLGLSSPTNMCYGVSSPKSYQKIMATEKLLGVLS